MSEHPADEYASEDDVRDEPGQSALERHEAGRELGALVCGLRARVRRAGRDRAVWPEAPDHQRSAHADTAWRRDV